MAKILVKTPITSNGRDVVLGADGKVRFKETVVEAVARKTFEKMNLKLPPIRQFKIEPYTEGDGSVEAPSISGKAPSISGKPKTGKK